MTTTSRFSGKRVLIGLCGGIAAYKVCDVIRQLYREGATAVQVVMTESAQAFVTPLTLETLTTKPVLTSAMSNIDVDGLATPVHVALAQTYDAFLILPATANMLAKLAYGLADDIVSTTALTFTHKPIVIAPAMNGRMWLNPRVQANLATLSEQENLVIVPPEWGEMACRETGEGKLAHQDLLLAYLYRELHAQHGQLKGERVVVTAGGTAEPIDAVRYMTNRSSGKMGLALADEAWAMGADVTLVHTLPELSQRPYHLERVKTVDDMADATHRAFETATCLVMSAAVSDFKASDAVSGKIKKPLDADGTLTLTLHKTRDILSELGQAKKPGQRLIGFAAESEIHPEVLQDKLRRKNVDLLVCNDISRADIGFGAEQNEVHILFSNGREQRVAKADKSVIAAAIWSAVADVSKLQKQTLELPIG